MTLGIAWIRLSGNIRELAVISDSRLSGGQYWDANPKIMLLPRTDCVISFAGDTNDAYPLMLQAYNAIHMFAAAATRGMDLADLKGHLIRVFNRSRAFISHLPVRQRIPSPSGAIFLLSGYSWRSKTFKIWKLFFDPGIGRFTFRPARHWAGAGQEGKLITFVGDEAAIVDAKRRLVERLRQKAKLRDGTLDMEPFEVLRDVIRSGRHASVGGAPQVVKIYEHMNAIPFGVAWPDHPSGTVTLLGRPLLDYERSPSRIIDPDQPLHSVGPGDE